MIYFRVSSAQTRSLGLELILPRPGRCYVCVVNANNASEIPVTRSSLRKGMTRPGILRGEGELLRCKLKMSALFGVEVAKCTAYGETGGRVVDSAKGSKIKLSYMKPPVTQPLTH